LNKREGLYNLKGKPKQKYQKKSLKSKDREGGNGEKPEVEKSQLSRFTKENSERDCLGD